MLTMFDLATRPWRLSGFLREDSATIKSGVSVFQQPQFGTAARCAA
jgi:hypothetical protein